MSQRRSLGLLVTGVILAIGVTIIISVSIGAIRDSVWFGRIVDRIEGEGVSEERLGEALRYARSQTDWRTLLRIAWQMPDSQRWRNVAKIAGVAGDRFRRDGSWRLYSAYALVRDGRFEEGRDVLDRLDSPSRLSQEIYLLTALDPNSPDRESERLSAFADRPDNEMLLQSIGDAFRNTTHLTLERAGEVSNVPEFYVAAALTAAEMGDREAARRITGTLRLDEDGEMRTRSRRLLYLARWLEDSEWFFRIAQSLGGREATRGDVRLMQAGLLVGQRQFERAERLYEEVSEELPLLSPVPFINRAAIKRLTSEFPEDAATEAEIAAIFEEGLSTHPQDRDVRLEYAVYLTSLGRRLDAISVLVPIGPIQESVDPTTQRRWLLTRAILGPRVPIERLEADLWAYLNSEPDAHVVAAFLAQFFLLRNDERGLSSLRDRYDPSDAAWAATIHGIEAVDRGDYDQGLAYFQRDSSVYGLYNQTLFYIRHGTIAEADAAVQRFTARVDREEDERWRVTALLVQAELSRMKGNTDEARAFVERAKELNPYNDTVYIYEALLAPQD